MIHRPLNTLTAVSLLLCVAVGMVWVRSYRYMEHFAVQDTAVGTAWVRRLGDATSSAPAPYAYVPTAGVQHQRLAPIDLDSVRPPAMATDRGWLGFRYIVVRKFEETRFIIVFPWWVVAGALSLLPARWIITRYRNRHRRGPGDCPVCGYDLTSNVSGVCPECGTPAPTEPLAG